MPKMTLMQPPPLKLVQFIGGFWGQRVQRNRKTTLPIQYQQCKQTGRLDAFKLDWKPDQPNKPHIFWDSDIAKWIEAAAYSLATHPDAHLSALVDDAVELIAAAQQPDGYLNIYFTAVEPEKRWTNLRDMHELYCAGHLMEAAVAHFEATGKRKLLDVMKRYADHIIATFGPHENQKHGYCGHPEIELALMKMHRATGEEKYRELSQFFVDERGRQPHYFDLESQARGEKLGRKYEYFSAHKPVREQREISGHSVRALYLLCAMIDLAAETGDKKLWAAGKRLWQNAIERRMYITGGVGSKREGERFTYDFDLPNETAYAETCANIALVFAAHRFLQIEPKAEYADVMERALYNGVISGVSLSGDKFFYANPLAVHDEALDPQTSRHIAGHRQEWFGCACCPPNLARLLASLGQYFYSTTYNEIFVHLYGSNVAELNVGGQSVRIGQRTDYPWQEKIELVVHPKEDAQFSIALRMPSWREKPQVKVNGRAIKAVADYLHIRRIWSDGDKIELVFPMPIRLMRTSPRSRNNIGKVAIVRGPIVYCIEEIDNGPDLHALLIDPKSKLTATHKPNLLGGVTVISGIAQKILADDDDLYSDRAPKTRAVKFQAVPYCVWGNRKVGRMAVWINELPSSLRTAKE
jgi:DUF1680 family protein